MTDISCITAVIAFTGVSLCRHGPRKQGKRNEGNGRNEASSRDHIGLFCGNFNAGVPCDSNRCTRRHKCSRYVDEGFCGGNHRAYEHE